jgi:hypothetical protein
MERRCIVDTSAIRFRTFLDNNGFAQVIFDRKIEGRPIAATRREEEQQCDDRPEYPDPRYHAIWILWLPMS